MTSGEVARPRRPKSALKARKVVFLELLKEQVNTAEDVLYTPKYLILLHQSNSQLSLVTRLQQSAL